MNRPHVLLCATLAIAACAPDGSAPSTEMDDPLYGLGSLALAWPGGTVPVCFTDPTAQQTLALRSQLPGILANSWSKAANIRFTGFGACGGPNAAVAVSFVGGTPGLTDDLGSGQRQVTLISNDTTPDLVHFQYEVIHEFGLALGFANEMKRPDNWVGGFAQQCPPPIISDFSQFSEAPGGVNLTSNYDPSSIMNLCDPGQTRQTTLSVGDVLGASSASAYGPSSCAFVAASTFCTARPQAQYDTTYTMPSGCPATTGPWVLKQIGVGAVAPAPEPNTFSLGRQAGGGVTSGPAIGSSPSYQMCDAFDNCGPAFPITINDCHTCPNGNVWDGNACAPPCNCKPGFYCSISGQCVRNNTCRPGTCM